MNFISDFFIIQEMFIPADNLFSFPFVVLPAFHWNCTIFSLTYCSIDYHYRYQCNKFIHNDNIYREKQPYFSLNRPYNKETEEEKLFTILHSEKERKAKILFFPRPGLYSAEKTDSRYFPLLMMLLVLPFIDPLPMQLTSISPVSQ